jgi:hypothetical protein
MFHIKNQHVTKTGGTSKTAVWYLENGGLVPRKRRFGTSKTAVWYLENGGVRYLENGGVRYLESGALSGAVSGGFGEAS